MSLETALGLRLTSAEAVGKIKRHDHSSDNLVSRVVPMVSPLGFPLARHEITIIKGAKSRTLNATGFIPKPKA